MLAVESARPRGRDAGDRTGRHVRQSSDPVPSEVPEVQFVGARYEFAVPVMVELYVSQLLDRDEFRRHCDRHRTRAAILRNLG